MTKRIRDILSIFLASSISAIPAMAEVGVSPDEIVWGSCVPLSGENKVNGEGYISGAKAYFAYLNQEKGGVNGRKIRLIVDDDGYDPEKAISCYNGLLKKFVFATGLAIGSPTAAKYVPMAETNKVPFVANAGAPGFMYTPFKKYVFAIRASNMDETSADVDHVWNDLGIRKIGVIFQDDAFGASGLDGIKAALQKRGSAPLVEASFVRNTTNIDEAYATVKAANPQAVFLVAVTVPASVVLKKAKAEGWHPIFIPVAGRDAQLIKNAGAAAEGIVIANTVPPVDEKDLPAVELYNRVMKKYAPSADRGVLSLQSFVDASIIAEGLRRAGSEPARDKFVAALESMADFDAGLGPDFHVRMGPDDHKAFDKIVFTVIHNGKVVHLTDWKKQLASAKPKN